MTNNLSANSVCNQLLKIVKDSNLNYLVNETPYSAYVTIRKTFVRYNSEVTLAGKDLAKENDAPQDKFEALIVENNILRRKLTQLESENKNINIRLEIAKGQLSNKNDAFEKVVKDKEDISEKNDASTFELKQAKSRLKKLENCEKEKDDNLLMLELTLRNRETEIDSLKTELETMKTRFQCEECDFNFVIESDLKNHMKTEHEVQCIFCNNSFAGSKKHKNHICKVHVENPAYKEYYTKDWFDRKKCIRVFRNDKKEEVIILHSVDCIEITKCADLPEKITDEKCFRDTHGLTHLRKSDCMNEKCMRWENIIAFYYKAKWAA